MGSHLEDQLDDPARLASRPQRADESVGLRSLAFRNRLTTQLLAMAQSNDRGDPSVIVVRDEAHPTGAVSIVAMISVAGHEPAEPDGQDARQTLHVGNVVDQTLFMV